MTSDKVLKWQSIKAPAEGEAVSFSYTHRFPAENEIPAHDYEGFLIRFKGELKAYRNSCPHIGAPLNWLPDQFFSEDRKELVCSVHDARFNPATGDCVSGPCPHGLWQMPVRNLKDGHVEVPSELAAESP